MIEKGTPKGVPFLLSFLCLGLGLEALLQPSLEFHPFVVPGEVPLLHIVSLLIAQLGVDRRVDGGVVVVDEAEAEVPDAAV